MKTTPLGNLATVVTGGTPDRGTPAYWGGTIPWVGTGEIDFNVIESPTEYLTERGLKESAARLLPSGTLLMAMYGQGTTRGKVGVLAIEAATNQACAAIIPKDGLIESEFLFYVLEASYTRIRRLSNTGSQENLNTTLIREIPIPVLPLVVRDKIVSTAKEWNAAIEKASTLLTTLEQRKKGLMQQLLTGRRRLKGFKGKWKTVPLDKLFEEVTRTSAEALPVMSISAGRGFLMQSDRFNRVQAGKNLANYIALFDGEFAYNKGNSKTYHCGCIYMLRGRKQAAVPNVYIAFRAKAEICPEFFEFYFEADILKHQLRRIINSGIRNDGLLNLNTEDFFRMEVPVPGLQEQAVIAKLLRTTTDEIEVLSKQLAQVKIQKRALMQKLLSGEWRLPKATLLKEFSV
jgi:type I restriction enzyme, S subunit